MTAVYLILGAIVTVWLFKFFFSLIFSPAKPTPKPAPKSAPQPRPEDDPAFQDDPTWLSVASLGSGQASPSQPIYASLADKVVTLIRREIPDCKVVYLERPHKRAVEVPADIAALPRHPRYKPAQNIGVISAQGKVYCISLFTYNITDQTREKFCKLLAQKLGCGCKLYTAQLPNSNDVLVERVLGCIISQNITPEEKQPQQSAPELIQTEDDVTPIPVSIQTFEWEDIDEED